MNENSKLTLPTKQQKKDSQQKPMKNTLLKRIFGKKRIVGLAGNKHTGKTNNLVYLIKDYRSQHSTTPIYCYGMPPDVTKYLKKEFKVKEISSLKHLIKKKNCILIIDEFQKLKLNDRRYKDTLAMFIDFVYHNNIYVIFSTPNIREFNSIIGSVIEKWLLKDVDVDACVRGSQLRKVVLDYQGTKNCLGSISMEKYEMLIIDESEEIVINCDYVPEADTKATLKNLF